MRFLYVDRSCKLHGGSTFALLLGAALVERGHDFTYAARGGPVSPLLRAAGVRHLKTLSRPINRWQIARHTKRQPYDVYLCSGRGQTDVALDLAEAAGRPTICFIQDPLRPRDTLEVLERPSALVTAERPIYEAILERGVLAERVTLIPRPIRSREFGPSAPDGFRVLFIGRLSENKAAAPAALMMAVPELARSIPDLRVWVVGKGAAEGATRNLARKANAACGREVVTMVGLTVDPLSWMEKSHLVVAGGYACMEAVYNGRPAIGAGYAWFGPVARGTVADGIACHFGDRSSAPHHPDAMRDAILTVHEALGDPTRADQYLNLRSEFAEDHSPAACAATIESLTARLTGAGRPRSTVCEEIPACGGRFK